MSWKGNGKMNKKILIVVTILFIVVLLIVITGCNSNNVSEVSGNNEDETDNQQIEDNIPQGDGTITFNLNISNPEESQDTYKIILAYKDSIQEGEALDSYFFKSYDISHSESLKVNIEDLSSIIYSVSIEDDPATQVTVVRTEDTNIRNPLCEPITLTFIDTQTCIQGKDITLNMADEPLTALYPEGTFLVKIQQKYENDSAGYVDFKYKAQDGSTLLFGTGSGGPDYLVPFAAKDFVERGIRETTLSISDYNNKVRSKEVELHFDENGYCKEGQFILMEIIN